MFLTVATVILKERRKAYPLVTIQPHHTDYSIEIVLIEGTFSESIEPIDGKENTMH